jgi:carboxymethylenebutenolidase
MKLKQFVLCVSLVLSAQFAFAGSSQIFKTGEGSVIAKVYSAPSASKAPAVILLHGYQCIAACAQDYERYALALTKQNFDVYDLEYYNEADYTALQQNRLDGEGYATRFQRWASEVRQVIEQVKAMPHANGSVALLGFSQGGRIAIASAANNPAVSALAVLYARLPDAEEMSFEIRTLPPLLLLHGNNDTVVPLAGSNAIFAKAQTLGAMVEMVVYPGAGHGFDFSADADAAVSARRHVLAFLAAENKKNP